MSTETYDERIAALKARIEQARAERDSVRAQAAAAEEAARQEREETSREQHKRLTEQMRGISDELQGQSEHIQQERTDIERRTTQESTYRESRAGRFSELTNTLSALRQSMQDDRERRKQHDSDVRKGIQSVKREVLVNAGKQRDALATVRTELYDDLDRKHEEIKGVLGATASVRESASFNDDGTDPTVDEIMDI